MKNRNFIILLLVVALVIILVAKCAHGQVSQSEASKIMGNNFISLKEVNYNSNEIPEGLKINYSKEALMVNSECWLIPAFLNKIGWQYLLFKKDNTSVK
jgi:hypothetical protein